jgi:hypothetical protein
VTFVETPATIRLKRPRRPGRGFPETRREEPIMRLVGPLPKICVPSIAADGSGDLRAD